MSKSEEVRIQLEKEIVELTQAINEIVCKFKKMRHPLAESRKQVPKATEQLDKITQQTEAATHRMLDVVEQITQREEEVVKGLTEISAWAEKGRVADIQTLSQTLKEHAEATIADTYTILDALQFQDITSQQMNHAASLLEEIEEKLHQIVTVLHGKEVPPTGGKKAKKERAYDPHADLFEKKTNQAEVDSLIANKAQM